jgi:hypothetical protein
LNAGDINGATSSSYTASAAGTYTCIVTNICGSTTSNGISVTTGTPPTATVTPAGNTNLCTGGSVTLNANTGAGLTYQWKLNTVDINGATSASYVASAAGTYTCVVTNACGSTTSNSISITITGPPTGVITASGSLTICSGDSVTLNATTGPGISWQWQLNGNSISGATASSYSATASGSYLCVFTNSCSHTSSNSLVVSVLTMPAIPGPISGQSSGICGDTITYNVGAVNGAAVYTWTVPPGAVINSGQGTTSVSVIFPIPFSSGVISVRAENICGTSGSSLRALVPTLNPTGAITGVTSACANTRYVYSVPVVPGADNYIWTVPAKAKIMSGQGTPTVDVRFQRFGGTISVAVGNACTAGTSATLPVTILSCTGNPHRVALDVSVFPNPSSGSFFADVSTPSEESCELVVMDMTGRIVEKIGNIVPGESVEFGGGLAAGMYSVEILQGEEKQVLRIVKSN